MAKRGSKSCNFNKFLLMALIIVLVYFAGKYILNYFRNQGLIEGYTNGNELVLCHMNGCGHCDTLMPEWDKASDENTTNIDMRKVEKDDSEASNLFKKHNVSGFPTILLLDASGNKLDTYAGERTKEGLLNYLNSKK